MQFVPCSHNKKSWGRAVLYREQPSALKSSRCRRVPLNPRKTGKTFEENALIKAKSARRVHRSARLADDSGLCVDALDGAPGASTPALPARARTRTATPFAEKYAK